MGSGDSSMVPSLMISNGILPEGLAVHSNQLPVKGSSTQSVGSVSRQSGGNHSRDLLPRWTAEDQEMEDVYQYHLPYTLSLPIEYYQKMY